MGRTVPTAPAGPSELFPPASLGLGCVSACVAAGLDGRKKKKKESRRAVDTAAEASCRSHASGSGARGFDADSWGPGYGTPKGYLGDQLEAMRDCTDDDPDPLAETVNNLCQPAVQLLEAGVAEAKPGLRPKPASLEESAATVSLCSTHPFGSSYNATCSCAKQLAS
jgi:hypothetical protein